MPHLFLPVSLGPYPHRGDGLIDFIQDIPKDTARRNCWPAPFVYPDRQAAREPFVTMVANGWQHQNMLIGEHFNAETGKLSEAGQAKVLWILNDAPPQHRNIFVHRAATLQETVAHIQAVQQFIAKSVPPNEFPPVLESTQSADGYSGDRYDIIARKFQQATLDPKLMAGRFQWRRRRKWWERRRQLRPLRNSNLRSA